MLSASSVSGRCRRAACRPPGCGVRHATAASIGCPPAIVGAPVFGGTRPGGVPSPMTTCGSGSEQDLRPCPGAVIEPASIRSIAMAAASSSVLLHRSGGRVRTGASTLPGTCPIAGSFQICRMVRRRLAALSTGGGEFIQEGAQQPEPDAGVDRPPRQVNVTGVIACQVRRSIGQRHPAVPPLVIGRL